MVRTAAVLIDAATHTHTRVLGFGLCLAAFGIEGFLWVRLLASAFGDGRWWPVLFAPVPGPLLRSARGVPQNEGHGGWLIFLTVLSREEWSTIPT